MSINLSRYGSVAPEPAPPAAAPAEGQTLTLQLRANQATARDGRMSGMVSVAGAQPVAPKSLRAAVVPADAAPLTITFG